MFLTTSDVDEIAGPNGLEKLKEFLEKRINEYRYIDYKRQLSGENKDKQDKEFLKDITAFANANGGNIIIGSLEPAEKLSVEKQLIGIEKGKKTAKHLEDIAESSVEPRISGLRIFAVPLGSERYTIIVHIPPSGNKPHMIISNNLNLYTFYIRNTETTSHMSIHDIRESIFETASREARAKEYLNRFERETRDYEFGVQRPYFHLQCIPLIMLEEEINILNNKILTIFDGGGKDNVNETLFKCVRKPKYTIDGLKCDYKDEEYRCTTEFHRNGYISAAWYVKRHVGNDSRFFVRDYDIRHFFAFTDLCSNLFAQIDIDVPLVFRCKVQNALGLSFHFKIFTGSEENKFEKDFISCSDFIRQSGQNYIDSPKHFARLLYFAFGKEPPIEYI